jgi:hypothetical protein
MNSQPWFFTGENDLLHAYCVTKGALVPGPLKRGNEVSVGIALCHAWVAGNHLGKAVEFMTDESARNGPRGYHYVKTMKVT